MPEKELSKKLLEVICCPKCKSDLVYLKENSLLICKSKKCAMLYKVENGIPVLLVD